MNKAFKGLNLKRGKKQNKERGKIVRKKKWWCDGTTRFLKNCNGYIIIYSIDKILCLLV